MDHDSNAPPSGAPAVESRKIALVLGGGGLKGFAHIGVLRALEERGVRPAVFGGTSIGALIAAAYAGGLPLDDMERRARSLRRRDLFRINHMGMLLERMRSPSIYLEEPLRALCENAVPRGRFDELPVPLLVNTVDVQRGTQVIWGLPGLRDVLISDAVYASCALPGFFPPGHVDGRWCIDGGTIDNLPVGVAAFGVDAIIAVDVGSSDLTEEEGVTMQGFASIYMRAATVMMSALQQGALARWESPPMILIRPRVAHIGWFGFSHTEELIQEGYRAGLDAIQHLSSCLDAPGGIFPRRTIHLAINRQKCTGCGLCVSLEPRLLGLDATGKAFARTEQMEWSPADGGFVRHCPTNAIEVKRVVPVLEPVS